MNLPDKVKVACFDIKIIDWEPREASVRGRFAEFSAVNQEIKIDTSHGDIKTVDSLLHEINHAIFWAYEIHDEDKEERICGTMSTAWTQIFRDNPQVMDFVFNSLRERCEMPRNKYMKE